jgi:hypothetical protein
MKWNLLGADHLSFEEGCQLGINDIVGGHMENLRTTRVVMTSFDVVGLRVTGIVEVICGVAI